MLYISGKNRTVKILTACLAAIMIVMMPLSGCNKTTDEEAPEITGSASETTVTETTVETTIQAVKGPYDEQKEAALTALSARLYENRKALYVYKDYGLSENMFSQKAKMYGINPFLAEDLNENWTENAYSGTCIRCAQKTREGDWNGWLWLTGYLPEGSTEPRLNDGRMDGQGFDLTGAEYLSFYARCDEGKTASVEFFCLGFGYDGETNKKIVKYPDSSKKKSLGRVTVTDEWKEYRISLWDANLSYIVCGFGYSINSDHNPNTDVVFYLDEIKFEGDIKSLQNAPVLIRSYDTRKNELKNVSYTYDNAVCLMAFVASDRQAEAKQLADAFVYAVRNDRSLSAPIEGKITGPARIRNAYGAGNIAPVPGWGFAARIPGWYDYNKKVWLEDRTMCGSNAGNSSYLILALLQYYAKYSGDEYLDTAKALADWIIENCSNSAGDGFTAGFDGWAEADPPVVYQLKYVSTEHMIDCYAAFKALYEICGDLKYKDASESAKRFIISMYDPERKLFMTGTKDDGITPDRSIVALDAQVWCAMALGDEFEPYKDVLETVLKMKTKEGGYSFSLQDDPKGFWCEGTAFTALLYRELGDGEKYRETMDALVKEQFSSGLFPAATESGHSTGIYLFDGTLWTYGRDPHIAPAAWMIMAATDGFNPYVIRK